MATFDEQNEVDKALIARLLTGTLIGANIGAAKIAKWQIPTGTTGRYIVFHPASPGAAQHAAGRLGLGRVFVDPLYLIRICGQTRTQNEAPSIVSLAIEMDTLLENYSVVTAAGARIQFRLEQPYETEEHNGPDDVWLMKGGYYRATVTGNS
jgi:hypothetical protein